MITAVCNFGYGWYTDTIVSQVRYKPYQKGEVQVEIGLHIGLRGLNITLQGIPEFQMGEQINYNEKFRWNDPWSQGRHGFGPYAGKFNQDFRAAQYRGTPYPIQWLAGYFTTDGEQIRFGRKFRLAGWYTHILMWLGFALYLIAIITSQFSVCYAAVSLLWLSIILIMASFCYGVIIINDPPLNIPVPSGRITPRFGWSWHLTCSTGIVTFIISVVVLVMHRLNSKGLALLRDGRSNAEEYPVPELYKSENEGISRAEERRSEIDKPDGLGDAMSFEIVIVDNKYSMQ